MKFFNVAILSAFVAPSVAATIFSGKTPGISANEDLKIPGDSPLELCLGDHGDDLVTIEKVDLLPNPPRPGNELVIKASGTVKKTIGKGAYAKITVKYGLIKLLTTTIDLCEQMGNVDLNCPLEPGHMVVEKSVDIPSQIPPGTYNVLADVYSDDDEQITCLTASVNFPRSSFFDSEDL